ncbi:MAG: hypothetical protein WCJ09_07325 [Planctomycetota bacterium]
MGDDELEALCSEIHRANDRMKRLLDDGASDQEIAVIDATIAEANLRLKQMITDKLAKNEGTTLAIRTGDGQDQQIRIRETSQLEIVSTSRSASPQFASGLSDSVPLRLCERPHSISRPIQELISH